MPEIEGTVERITYYNPDSFYTVARLTLRDKEDLVTAVGYLPELEAGEVLKLCGDWVFHKDYGRQFHVERYETLLPSSAREIENYLASGIIKGIGPVTAKRIVDRFKEKALEVLSHTPDELLLIEGIGEKRLQGILASFEEQQETRDIMMFLQQYGIGPGVAARVYRNYKQRAVDVIKENPYRLAEEVYGIGFKTADKIASRMGMERDSPKRLTSGLQYTLSQAANQGHVFLPEAELMKAAAELLEVEEELLLQPLAALAEKDDVAVEKAFGSEDIYLVPFYVCETAVARRLLLLSALAVKKLPLSQGDLDALEEGAGVKMAKRQKEAIERAAQSGVLVVTGGPGTGKTTIVRSLVDFFQRHKMSVALAAPTGRAAKRMTEATGTQAKTLHRLLEYKAYEQGGMAFGRNSDNLLEEDVIIVDETSMVDIILMHHLLAAINPGARLILVGDHDQLPSVGPGCVLGEIIKSGQIPVVVLDEIFRQAKESMIVVNAHRINQGLFPFLNVAEKDFFFEQIAEPEQSAETIVDLVKARLPKYKGFDPLEDIQVITPMKKGSIGVINLNERLQAELNPPHPQKAQRGFRNSTFRVGDKVMQIKNNYEKEVFNGDLGYITKIDEDGTITVSFADGGGDREVEYLSKELEELSLAYALSVHKSQGSEFSVVVMPVTTQHYVMLQRNLLYTAVTRAKRLLVLVGTKRALHIAVSNNKAVKRYGHLAERIRGEFSDTIAINERFELDLGDCQ